MIQETRNMKLLPIISLMASVFLGEMYKKKKKILKKNIEFFRFPSISSYIQEYIRT